MKERALYRYKFIRVSINELINNEEIFIFG